MDVEEDDKMDYEVQDIDANSQKVKIIIINDSKEEVSTRVGDMILCLCSTLYAIKKGKII